MANSVLATSSNTRATSRRDDTPSEYAGIWLNFGVQMNTGDGESKYVRLPRGVAVEDLQTKKVFPTMDPDYAAEVTLVNQLIELIREAGLKLEEGGSQSINLEAQIYKRMEESEPVQTAEDTSALKGMLFSV